MSGLAGVIATADGTTATLTIPGSDPITATIPANLATVAIAGVQAIAEWQNPADPDAQGNWAITQAGGVPGVIARDGLDPAVQSDIATGVQASSKADTAQAAAQAAQQTADAAKAAAVTATSQAGVAQSTADSAKADAATAAGIAGGKADVLIQASQPAAAMQKATTLWIDTTSSANTPKTWNGTTWVAVTDKKATDAAAAASSAQGTATQAQQDANAAKANAATAQTAATAAQATADSKRRNFSSTPTPPYDVGDTWTGGPSGELMRCKTAKAAGAAYAAADWEKASKYTDDTAANAASAAAASAAAQAGVAIATANGKNISTHSITDPSTAGVSGQTNGDMWYRHVQLAGKPAGDLSGPVDGQWTWQQGQWIGMGLTAGVFASVDGGVATFGSVSGLDIFSPSSTALPRMEVQGPALRIVRATSDADTTGQTTTLLGGQDGDQLTFFDSDGQPKGGFSPDGTMTSDSVLTGAVSIAGTDILDIVQAGPQGVLAGHRFPSSTTQNADINEHGTVDVLFTAKPGRTYRVVADGAVRASDATFPQVTFRYTSTTDGSTPAQPTVSSPVMKLTRVTGPTAGLSSMGLHMEYVFNLAASDPETTYRVLLTIKSATTDGAFFYGGTTFFMEDLGSTYTGIWADGTDNKSSSTTPVVTYEKTFNASWTRFFMNANQGYSDSGNIQQGFLYNVQFSGMIGFPAALTSAIAGAQSVAFVSVQLPCQLAKDSNGFVPRIGHHASSGRPLQFSGSDTYDASPALKSGGTAWFNLPSSWIPSIANGAYKGLSFGGNTGTGSKYAGIIGKNVGTTNDPSWAPIVFKARWTK